MNDAGKFDLFADTEESPFEEDRQTAEEYNARFCQDPPLETRPGTVYEVRNLKLSIEDGYVQLVCASCGKPPPWAEDFMDGVSMEEIPVTSTLTGAGNPAVPHYEPDGPYIELKIRKKVKVKMNDERKHQIAKRIAAALKTADNVRTISDEPFEYVEALDGDSAGVIALTIGGDDIFLEIQEA